MTLDFARQRSEGRGSVHVAPFDACLLVASASVASDRRLPFAQPSEIGGAHFLERSCVPLAPPLEWPLLTREFYDRTAMSDLRRVHRFRDHAVAGVNWRPTRFVNELPSLRVCCLCRMIPKRIFVLPCGHLLCQSCVTASSQGRGGRCPLDQEPFEEAKCHSYDFNTRTVKALKVHCWNEGHGCKFEGAMEIMLRHYENECTFHTVECFRCDEQVLHSELPAHYSAGCSAAVSLACPKNTSSDSQAFTLRDVTGALAELKALLRGANQELLLPMIESRMNELTERIRNLESMSAVITRAAREAVTSDLVQVAAPSPSASQIKETSRQTATEEEAGASSTSQSCSGENLNPPQLEPLVDLPREVLEAMRKTSSQDYPRHAFTNVKPDIRLELVGLLPTALSWREVFGTVEGSNPGCGGCISDGGGNVGLCAQIWVHPKEPQEFEISGALHYGVSRMI
ncbi:hypothetical protein HPB51_012853 [Rhipicephalus microplus]|uniref:RING-type domain-containing protein n=1 Tax=Rhipicephalus microplus TaxID=6941 RepID=A0A9J6EAN6_RHIMP|nr:hypothetical protein HPB51_012853 [Rhipicephalus microplus]